MTTTDPTAETVLGEEDLPARIRAKISFGPDCWIWTASQNGAGYGSVGWQGRTRRAHRLVYEMLVGPIPEGLTLDHLCRNRICVRPDHLEPVTNRENVLRGVGPTALNAQRDECVNGHPLSGDNLYVRPEGDRRCRTCARGQKIKHRTVQQASRAGRVETVLDGPTADRLRSFATEQGLSVSRAVERLILAALADSDA